MRRRRRSGQIVVGVLFMMAGAALMLDNMGVVMVGELWRYWPLVLIGLGTAKLVEGPPRRRYDGVWLIMIGTWLLLNMLDILRWDESWPLMIVAVGINMVLRAMYGPDRSEVEFTANSTTETRHE